MKLLKIGISGVRGIVGDTLTPELIMDFASAFGTYLNSKKVLLGRDTRISGPMLHSATTAALLAVGCDVVDLGICPAPILQYMVKSLKAKGAISISAGHNDADWNALTFINQEGTYLNSYQGEEMLDIYHLEKFKKVSTDKLGALTPHANYLDIYFDKLTNFLDSGAIKKATFKVVIDACNGGGAGIVDAFCKHLGCELIPVNNEQTGYFPHDPEPRPRNASEVASITKIMKADVGFLLNSDVSRISIVAEDGETLSEEYTLPLIAGYYLRKKPGAVITNYSTSRMIEDVSQCFGCHVIKAKVGQSDGIQTMIEEDGVMAGEGSGSVSIKEFQPAFDGFLAMGMILEMMAVNSKKISAMVKELPKYHIIKDKIYCPPVKAHSIVNEIKKLYASQEISTIDGIKIEWKDGWIHIRASATEPMIRIISESKSREKAQERLDKAANFVSQLV
ncbi:MAG TPA: phosphoglucosamine mutase [Candidatus Heimdallarchaeota archaeon]|nr:phosphoglucosamine mutase [Candidatus Heimdallarchaeota archaeon]